MAQESERSSRRKENGTTSGNARENPFTLAIAATRTERLKSGANSTLANGESSARRDLRPTNATKSPLSRRSRSLSLVLARLRRSQPPRHFRDYATLVRLHLASVSNRLGCWFRSYPEASRTSSRCRQSARTGRKTKPPAT